MICPRCGLDGPCSSSSCEARGTVVHRCPSCTAPFPSREAAARCADLDDDTRSLYAD